MKIDNGDILSPLPTSFGSFFIVSFIAFLYNRFGRWNITFNTVLIILTSLLTFLIGYVLSRFPIVKTMNIKKSYTYTTKITNTLMFVLIFFELIVTALNFRATLKISKFIYQKSTIINMLMYARNAYIFTDASINKVLSLFILSTNGIAYYLTYHIILQIITEKYSSKILIINESIYIFISLLNSMLGTGRTFLIKWMVYFVFSYYYLLLDIRGIKKFKFNEIIDNLKICICAFIIFFFAFQFMGIFTGKTGKLNSIDMLYEYSGSAIIALNNAIEEYKSDGRVWGEECFYGLYGFLNKFGFNIPNRILHLPFTQVGDNIRTNIYSSIRSYLYDFGFFGIYIIQFIIGFTSGILYRLLRYTYSNNPFYILLYGLFMYGIVMQGIEEILFRNFMSVTNIILVVSFYLMYFFTTRIRIIL